MRYWTADLHFGHQNIIDYENRPFDDVEEMNEAMINTWNSVVRDPDDEVWVVGDFALGKIADTLPLASRLNGKKILICGNHDRPWHGHKIKNRRGWKEKYIDAGFEEVWIDGAASTHIGTTEVIVNHFPYAGDSRNEDRFIEHRPKDCGFWLIHGHVHSMWIVKDKMINVGVDVWDGCPVSDDEIDEIIRKGFH